jgi:hypothetical protein
MEEKTVILVINAPNLRPITIACGENETIGDAKKKFYEEAKTQEFNQWKFNAEVLKDHKKICDYGLEDQDEISAVRERDGGY